LEIEEAEKQNVQNQNAIEERRRRLAVEKKLLDRQKGAEEIRVKFLFFFFFFYFFLD
jgi:hypothetical protein